MTYSAMQIADYLIQKHINMNRPITNMRLQKLLYFSWVGYFKDHRQHLFEDKMYAWKYGPVVRDVYREYSVYGGMPITSLKNSREAPVLDRITVKSLDKVVEYCKDISTAELVDITHTEGSPWDKAYIEGRKDICIGFRDIEAACNDNHRSYSL